MLLKQVIVVKILEITHCVYVGKPNFFFSINVRGSFTFQCFYRFLKLIYISESITRIRQTVSAQK
jgi:hypothetical protein